jgi:hypothetical protein
MHPHASLFELVQTPSTPSLSFLPPSPPKCAPQIVDLLLLLDFSMTDVVELSMNTLYHDKRITDPISKNPSTFETPTQHIEISCVPPGRLKAWNVHSAHYNL